MQFNEGLYSMGPEVEHLYRSCDLWVLLGPTQQIPRIKRLIGSLIYGC